MSLGDWVIVGGIACLFALLVLLVLVAWENIHYKNPPERVYIHDEKNYLPRLERLYADLHAEQIQLLHTPSPIADYFGWWEIHVQVDGRGSERLASGQRPYEVFDRAEERAVVIRTAAALRELEAPDVHD